MESANGKQLREDVQLKKNACLTDPTEYLLEAVQRNHILPRGYEECDQNLGGEVLIEDDLAGFSLKLDYYAGVRTKPGPSQEKGLEARF